MRGSTWEFLNNMPAGPVLPDRSGPKHAVPHCRRPAGQQQLGRPQPHLQQGRHPQRRLDRTSAAATASTACSIRRIPTLFTLNRRAAKCIRFNARTGEMRGWKPKPTEGQPRVPLPVERAADRQPAPQGRPLPGGQPRVQTHAAGRALRNHQPRPLAQSAGQDHHRGQHGGELRGGLCPGRVAAESRPAVCRHG